MTDWKVLINDALGATPWLDDGVYDIEGMSGRKYRSFINNLVRFLPDARYLEVGSWKGSTLCAAINRNRVRAVAIDDWSEFDGPKSRFEINLKKFKTEKCKVRFIESDFRAVDFASLGKFNIYMYDGPHEPKDQHDGIRLALPALDDEFVLVIDDWNWERVRKATMGAMHDLGLDVIHKHEIRTTDDDTHPPEDQSFGKSHWHNGYLISALRKPVAALRKPVVK